MQNYSLIEKILHTLVLNNNVIKKSLFEIEKFVFYKNIDDIQNEEHIFITGLPRSGTTILLEYIYKNEQHASFTYNDMPFIMSPNLFSIFNNKKLLPLKERWHKDGIKFNLQSPEAFDDIFFQTYSKSELQEYLKIFISLILKKNKKKKYLSKNNNNFKRILIINSILPNAKFIIPFRSPLQHAQSLLNQHKNFCEIQNKDKFVLKYMNYLGHHEFGLGHKSWHLSKDFDNPFSLDYWLEQWLLFYSKLINEYSNNKSVFFISYERFCESNELQKKLLEMLNIKYSNDFLFEMSKKKIEKNYDQNLLNKCFILENKLKLISKF